MTTIGLTHKIPDTSVWAIWRTTPSKFDKTSPRGNTQHPNTLRSQPGVALRISRGAIATRMHLPIHLHSQLRPGTEEIEHIAPCRVLAAKL